MKRVIFYALHFLTANKYQRHAIPKDSNVSAFNEKTALPG